MAFRAVFVTSAIFARDTGGFASYRDDSYKHTKILVYFVSIFSDELCNEVSLKFVVLKDGLKVI